MNVPSKISIRGQQLWMSGEKTLFWEENKTLILSDLHLGKTGHFRKSGIPVPTAIYQNDLYRLLHIVQYFQPEKIIFVGDLTHSYENTELKLFQKWRNDLAPIKMQLVKGNHDILSKDWYDTAGLTVHHRLLLSGPFCFVHDPIDAEADDNLYSISGHLHPGVLIKGMGKQTLRFPCFHFGKKMGFLPAFSEFTGMALVESEKEGSQFAIVDKKVIPLQ